MIPPKVKPQYARQIVLTFEIHSAQVVLDGTEKHQEILHASVNGIGHETQIASQPFQRSIPV